MFLKSLAALAATMLAAATSAHAGVLKLDYSSTIDGSAIGGEADAAFNVEAFIDLDGVDVTPDPQILTQFGLSGSISLGGETTSFANGVLQVFDDIDIFGDGVSLDALQILVSTSDGALFGGDLFDETPSIVSYVLVFSSDAFDGTPLPLDLAFLSAITQSTNTLGFVSSATLFNADAPFDLDAQIVPIPAVGLLAFPLFFLANAGMRRIARAKR